MPAELIAWILNPTAIDPGTAMPAVGATVEQAQDMAAYLYTLGARPRERLP
jgi:cytochrome c